MLEQQLSDEELIGAVALGNEEAFRTLMRRYKKPVLNYIYRYVGDTGWAEDLAQDVFVRVYRNADKFEQGRKFGVWLFRIARNVAVDFMRSRQSEHRAMNVVQDRERDREQGGERSSRMIANAEAAGRLHAAISELPEHYRDVLVLCDLQGMTYEEASHVTEAPVKTVSSRLFRARNALRKKFAAYGLG